MWIQVAKSIESDWQSFSSLQNDFSQAIDIFIRSWWRKRKMLNGVNEEIRHYLFAKFDQYLWKSIVLQTKHLGKIEWILENIEDYPVAGPCLKILPKRKKSVHSWVSAKYDIVWIDELQYGYEVQEKTIQMTKNKVSEIL